MSAIILTGATGFVGSHILRALLEQQYQVVCLVRQANGVSVHRRVIDCLNAMESYYEKLDFDSQKLTVVVADIIKPNCAISVEDLKIIRVCDPKFVIHAAAETRFQESLSNPRIVPTNTNGTINVATLANSFGIQEFCHISTAFVGRRGMVTPESLFDIDEGHDNVYASSKWSAEQLLAGYCQEHNITPMIVRPPVIVGDSDYGYTSLFNGFYTMLYLLLNASERGMKITTIPGDHDAPIAVAPIDYVVDGVMAVIEATKTLRCGVFNMIPATMQTARWWLDLVCKHFGMDPIGFVPNLVIDADDRIVRHIEAVQSEYAAYLFEGWQWQTDRMRSFGVKEPVIDSVFALRIFDFAVAANFGRNRSASS